MRSRAALAVLALAGASALPAEGQSFDVLVRGGTVYDGGGGAPRQADVGIVGDRITAVGALSKAEARTVIDATGLAVAPGFINVLSWSTESLIVDGRSQGEIRQGVTTQVFGEGWSMGPLTDAMKKRETEEQGDIKYDITWTTLADYLAFLEKKGVSPNVASFIGAATVREHVMGLGSRAATPEQIQAMRELVRREMEAGALGIGSSLIYAPGFYASTEELIELCKEAAKYQGSYISHLRSEADRLLEAVDEIIRISRGGPDPGRDLSPEGRRRGQLAQDGRGHREDRGRAPRGPEDHRGHVHLHRGGHGVRRLRAAVGPRRRIRGVVPPAAGRAHPEPHPGGDDRARQGLGEPLRAARALPSASCSWGSRTRRSSRSRARPWPRWRRRAAIIRGTPSSTSCWRTARAWASFSS